MSSVNYSLKNKGVRLIDATDAWKIGKDGSKRLNPKYRFVGKIDTKFPNIITTASDKIKPKFKGNTCDLNSKAKGQIIDHFYDNNGKCNKKTVAYFGIEKKKRK